MFPPIISAAEEDSSVSFSPPKEVAQSVVEANVTRSKLSIPHLLLLGILAGAFIAIGAQGSTMAAHDVTTLGIGFQRFLTGSVFSVGLMLVINCGAELFTGNVLMWMGVLDRKIAVSAMLRNWFWVLLANLVGAVGYAFLMSQTGLFKYNNNLLGVSALTIAVGKVSLTWTEAFVRAILCNWLVGLAIWMSFASKDIISKCISCYVPVMMFVMSGFEHSIANFYYLPAGWFAKQVPAVVEAANLGAKADILTWSNIITHNWIPVLLGNVLGSALFVATFYWFVYVRDTAKTPLLSAQDLESAAD